MTKLKSEIVYSLNFHPDAVERCGCMHQVDVDETANRTIIFCVVFLGLNIWLYVSHSTSLLNSLTEMDGSDTTKQRRVAFYRIIVVCSCTGEKVILYWIFNLVNIFYCLLNTMPLYACKACRKPVQTVDACESVSVCERVTT